MSAKKSKGIFFIILSAFCFALMNMFVRLSGDLPSVQKSFFRNLVAFGFAVFLLMRDKKTNPVRNSDSAGNPREVSGGGFLTGAKKSRSAFAVRKRVPGVRFFIGARRGNLKYLLIRSAAGTLGILCNFYAVDHLVLSDASMLNKMSPFFAIIFSIFVLKERIRLPQLAIVTGAFLGSLLILKPTGSSLISLPALIGLLGGMAAGLAYTYVRLLGERGEKGAFVVAFFSGFSCLVTLPFLIFDFHFMSGMQVAYLLLAGLAAAGGQFSITAAYFHAPAREISVYDYSQILFSALLGFLVFSQTPDLLSVIGYAVIILMAVLMFARTARLTKKEGIAVKNI